MSVMTLYPYLYHGICWVFDDPQTGLKEEAFVLGASEMISRLLEAKGIPNAERGFALSFSDRAIRPRCEIEPGYLPGRPPRQLASQSAACLRLGTGIRAIVAGEKMVCLALSGALRVFRRRTEKNLRQSREVARRRRSHLAHQQRRSPGPPLHVGGIQAG